MTDTTAPARPRRMCDSCGGVDDHPRHVVGIGPDDPNPTSDEVAEKALSAATSSAERREILAQIRDDSTQVKHMDCCRADGCPDGSCSVVTAGVEQLRGLPLAEHLTSLLTTVLTPKGA